MGKPNWACGECGMYSSRKESVRRHVKNLHNGNGLVISFADYLIGRRSGIFGPYFPAPTYTPKAEPSLADKVLDEYWKELAKGYARQRLYYPNTISQPTIWQQSYNNNNTRSQPEPYDFWSDSEQVFGLEASVCVECLSIKLSKVCFSEKENYIRRIKLFHDCDPTFIATSELLTDTDEIVKNPECLIPTALSQYVKIWADDKSILITAIELPFPLAKTVKLITRSQKENGLKHLILPFSPEKCLDIDLTSSEDKLHYHWAKRAINDTYTSLNNAELIDFLNKTKNSTFAFFRVELKKGIKRYYLMGIAPAIGKADQPKILLDEQKRTNSTSQSQKQ
jgi:hypothetical protein